jgi:hypothetical protein
MDQLDGIQVQRGDCRAARSRESLNSGAAQRPGEMPRPLLLAGMKEFDAASGQGIRGGGVVMLVLIASWTAVAQIFLITPTAARPRDDVIDLP